MSARTLSVCLVAALCARLGAADLPNPTAVRAQIDKLVAARLSERKPADLGLLRDIVLLTINYGGQAFDAGDAKGCASFYLATATHLGASFASDKDATAAARESLHDLADAAGRAKALADPAHQAWALRFAFDQVSLASTIVQAEAQAEVQLGSQYFGRGDFEEAEIGFTRAAQEVDELIGADGGADLAAIQVNPRVAGIIHAQVLLARGKVKEAAPLMASSLLLVPELPNSNFDWKKIAGDPDPDKDMAAAADAARDHAGDVAYGVLLAMEQKFNGHVDDAAKTLAALDKDHPGNAAVQMLLGQKGAAAAPKPAGTAPATGGTGEFVP